MEGIKYKIQPQQEFETEIVSKTWSKLRNLGLYLDQDVTPTPPWWWICNIKSANLLTCGNYQSKKVLKIICSLNLFNRHTLSSEINLPSGTSNVTKRSYFQHSYIRKRPRRKGGVPMRLWAGLSASCCVLSDSAEASFFGGPTSPEKRRYVETWMCFALCMDCACTYLFRTLVPTTGKVKFPHFILSMNSTVEPSKKNS